MRNIKTSSRFVACFIYDIGVKEDQEFDNVYSSITKEG
jgi:hypothetical protein